MRVLCPPSAQNYTLKNGSSNLQSTLKNVSSLSPCSCGWKFNCLVSLCMNLPLEHYNLSYYYYFFMGPMNVYNMIPQTGLSCRGPGGSLRAGRTYTRRRNAKLTLILCVCVFTVFERSRFTALQRNGGYSQVLRARSQKKFFLLSPVWLQLATRSHFDVQVAKKT